MLKSMAVLGAAVIMTVAAHGQQQPPRQAVQVREGLLLKFATTQPLDPDTAKRGDDIPLVLTRPFEVDGVTLLSTGEILHGTVTGTTKAGPHCKNGEIKWKLEQITFHDGSVVKTRVGTKSERVNGSVPYEIVKHPTPAADRAGEVIEAVVLSPALIGLTIAWAVKAPFHQHGCSQYTKDGPLPTNATIGVEITEKHAVRY